MDTVAKTKFSRNELLILQTDPEYVVDDAGEYVECSLCRARGWKDEIVHDSRCLLCDDAVVSVVLVGIINPALIYTKCYGTGEVRQACSLGSDHKTKCGRCGGTGRRV